MYKGLLSLTNPIPGDNNENPDTEFYPADGLLHDQRSRICHNTDACGNPGIPAESQSTQIVAGRITDGCIKTD